MKDDFIHILYQTFTFYCKIGESSVKCFVCSIVQFRESSAYLAKINAFMLQILVQITSDLKKSYNDIKGPKKNNSSTL